MCAHYPLREPAKNAAGVVFDNVNTGDGHGTPENAQLARLHAIKKNTHHIRRTGGEVCGAGQRRNVAAGNEMRMFASP